jgi:predicted transcriptional regulator
MMRTTVTLDPDVERLLKEAAHETRQSFKQVLNDAVRAGLRSSSATVRRKRFSVKARPMGLRPGIDPTRLTELADELEAEAFLKTTRRLARKKK